MQHRSLRKRKRLVHVRNADKLKKTDSEAIISYLKSPCETTVLLLEAEKLAKNTRLYKAIAAIDSGRSSIALLLPLKSFPRRYDLSPLAAA